MGNKKIRLGMLGAGRICTDIRFEHGIIYPSDKE